MNMIRGTPSKRVLRFRPRSHHLLIQQTTTRNAKNTHRPPQSQRPGVSHDADPPSLPLRRCDAGIADTVRSCSLTIRPISIACFTDLVILPVQ